MKAKVTIPDPIPTGIELTLNLSEYVLMCVVLYSRMNGHTATFGAVRTSLEEIWKEWGEVFPEDRKGFVRLFQDASKNDTTDVGRAEAICAALGI